MAPALKQRYYQQQTYKGAGAEVATLSYKPQLVPPGQKIGDKQASSYQVQV
jgi:hypothetical protein